MQIAIVTGPSYEMAARRIEQANETRDGIELRLDLFEKADPAQIERLKKLSSGKVIFTLRHKRNGGGFVGNEERRLNLAKELLALEPDYFDFESDTDPTFLQSIFPTKIILSYHNFTNTPKDLDWILEKMIALNAYAYKICTTANSLADAYKMLRFIQRSSKSIRIIGLCMGDYGRITRTEGTKSGNYLNYTILNLRDKVAPGLTLA